MGRKLDPRSEWGALCRYAGRPVDHGYTSIRLDEDGFPVVVAVGISETCVINLSRIRCRVTGKPHVVLLSKFGEVLSARVVEKNSIGVPVVHAQPDPTEYQAIFDRLSGRRPGSSNGEVEHGG